MASCLFCSRKAMARGKFVKLVFPGGHVELLDRPVMAAEVMARHPRFCVARPDVFREPASAVASPDAVLALGDKYYVVPKSTVRRLLKHASSSSSSYPHAGAGGVSLKRHLASSGRRKSWLRSLVGDGDGHDGKPQQSRRSREGASHGGKGEAAVVGEVDVRETKENGKAPGGQLKLKLKLSLPRRLPERLLAAPEYEARLRGWMWWGVGAKMTAHGNEKGWDGVRRKELGVDQVGEAKLTGANRGGRSSSPASTVISSLRPLADLRVGATGRRGWMRSSGLA
ncbi:hypothetical protein E2562_006444 [Oryza meyeriana var. granulata]|uniref:Uncharacterized protein n=1 Tax=Oryza meyeriana var. granulata TaxID=110450 RepID=A0A6G1CNW0_9ORYZ|nr:hypothetical protein E2562_006444 [Oryza meyeriana var. granulata]